MPIIRTDKPLRSRAEHDFYPTPPALIRSAYEFIQDNLYIYCFDYGGRPNHIIDLGAGDGEWGTELKKFAPKTEITGVDIRALPQPEGYDKWIQADVLNFKPTGVYDIVIGNPPYKYAESFIRKGLEILVDYGLMIMLLPLQFLASQKRGKGLWKEENLSHLLVCSRRPSFTRNGKTDNTDYGVYIWQNAARVEPPQISWLDWDYE